MKKVLEKIDLSTLFLFSFGGLFFHSLTLSFANTVGYKISSTGFLWSHWFGFLGWALPTFIGYKLLTPKDQIFSKFLFPTASILSGIGILTIWRVNANLGFRQTLIYAFSVLILSALTHKLDFIKHIQKWIFIVLLFAIFLLAGSLVFGVNPGGSGPNLWVGCCGIYLQPSEPLKIILLLVLAFYLPTSIRKVRGWKRLLWVVSVILTIFLILLAQRDLGTGTIFLILTISVISIYLNNPKILSLFGFGLILAGFAGYFSVPLIKTRINTWLSPWDDPANSGYQIIQSLISIANGGINGRGPGLGYPSLVPISFSDFIFTAISEEMGLIGAVLVLSLIAVLVFLAFSIAKQAKRVELSLLASGIGVYFGAQSIIIIGGNINLLPLTGVTLPFLSYGGSSLFSSYFAIALLIEVSKTSDTKDQNGEELSLDLRSGVWVANLLFAGILICGLTLGYWSLIRGEELLARTDNPRRSLSDLYSKRGMIVDRNNQILVSTVGEKGNYQRNYVYPFMSPILGYTHPTYGQSNIEESFDDYLRGDRGQPDLEIWWVHLVFGRPPDGLNIRSTIDLLTQEKIVNFVDGENGSSVLITPNNGEIIAAVSVPFSDLNDNATFFSNNLTENSHLLNRVSLGQYPSSLVMAILSESGLIGDLPNSMSQILLERNIYQSTEVGFEINEMSVDSIYLSPLQIVSIFSGLSNYGTCVDLKFISAVQITNQDWVILPTKNASQNCFTQEAITKFSEVYLHSNSLFWSVDKYDPISKTYLYISGTDTNWTGRPLLFVLVLEDMQTNSIKTEADHFFSQLLLNK